MRSVRKKIHIAVPEHNAKYEKIAYCANQTSIHSKMIIRGHPHEQEHLFDLGEAKVDRAQWLIYPITSTK